MIRVYIISQSSLKKANNRPRSSELENFEGIKSKESIIRVYKISQNSLEKTKYNLQSFRKNAKNIKMQK